MKRWIVSVLAILLLVPSTLGLGLLGQSAPDTPEMISPDDRLRLMDERDAIIEDLSVLAWKNIIENYNYAKGSVRGRTEVDVWTWLLALGAWIAAREKGYVTYNESLRAVSNIIFNLEEAEKWHGLWYKYYKLDPIRRGDRPVANVVPIEDDSQLLLMLMVVRQAFPELDGRVTKLIEDAGEGYRKLYGEFKNGYGLGPTSYNVVTGDLWYSRHEDGVNGEAVLVNALYSYYINQKEPLMGLITREYEYHGIRYLGKEGLRPWVDWCMLYYLPKDSWRWRAKEQATKAYTQYHIDNNLTLGYSDGSGEKGWISSWAPETPKHRIDHEARSIVLPQGVAVASAFFELEFMDDQDSFIYLLQSLKFWTQTNENGYMYGAYNNASKTLARPGHSGHNTLMFISALNFELIRQYSIADPIVTSLQKWLNR